MFHMRLIINIRSKLGVHYPHTMAEEVPQKRGW